MPEGEARWIADPTRRHELRWWNGTRWTEHVSDHGVEDADWGPNGPPAPRTAPRPRVARTDNTESRGLLEESPRRQAERERRRTLALIAGALLLVAAGVAVAVTVGNGSSGGGSGTPSSGAEERSGQPTESEDAAARQAVLQKWGDCLAAVGITSADVGNASVEPTNGSENGRPVNDNGRVMLVTLSTGEAFIVHLSGPTTGDVATSNAAARATLDAAGAAGQESCAD